MQPTSDQHYQLVNASQSNQNVPLLTNLGVNTANTEVFFQQYRNFLASFEGNIDCRIIPSKKGSSLVLTKAGAEKICRFFGLNYSLIQLPQTQLDFVNNVFYYAYECRLSHSGMFVGNGFGNCNNRESKYIKVYGPDVLNTLDKMAQKRALISAVLFTTGGSRFFGPKLSDLNN